MDEIDEVADEIGRAIKEAVKEIKTGIRQSKHGLLKLIALETVPVVLGAGMAGIGRATGAEFLPAIPIAMDVLSGGLTNPGRILGLMKYRAGVALVYADKIYYAISQMQNLI